MVTAYLVNFGFDTSIILELVSEFSPKTGDKIVLLRPIDEIGIPERAARAVNEIRGLVSTLREANRLIELQDITLDTSNPIQVTADIANAALKLRETFERIVVDVSAGVRPITVATMLCAALNPALFDEVTMLTEPSRRRIRLPIREALELKVDRLAMTLAEASCNRDLKSLGLKLRTSEASVSRRITQLERIGLVSHKRGKISLTALGSRILPLAKAYISQHSFKYLDCSNDSKLVH